MKVMVSVIPAAGRLRLRRLSPADTAGVQALCQRCADYFLLHEGTPPGPSAAGDIFEALPPGKSAADKFVFGVESAGGLKGIVDLVRDFPETGTWMLGLLLLEPSERGRGTGKAVHKALASWAAGCGAAAFRIGVVEENARGRRFWSSLGYLTQKDVSMRLGQKKHRVLVMTRPVP